MKGGQREESRGKGWLLIALLILASIKIGSNVVRLYKVGGTVKEAEKQLEEAKIENAELERKLVMVQTPEYMERLAREKLGYGFAGEEVLVLPEQNDGDKRSVIGDQGRQEPNWKQWRKLYLNF